jgi:transcription factor E
MAKKKGRSSSKSVKSRPGRAKAAKARAKPRMLLKPRARAVKKAAKKSRARAARKPARRLLKPKLSALAKARARAKARAQALKLRERAAREKLRLEQEKQKALEKLRLEQEKLEIARLNALLSNTYARQFLVDLAGENTLAIMKSFAGRVSDEDLSKKLKIKISDVRATLNKLHSQGLVSYVREKDNETGWFSYSWALNREKIEFWVTRRAEERNPAVFSENSENYFCANCGVESLVPFEHAMSSNFKCPKCERNLEFVEKDKLLDDLPFRTMGTLE